MDRGTEVVHLLILCLVVGIFGQVLSAIFSLPSILFLLLGGVALGPDGLGLIDPGRLGKGLEVMVRISVAFILFEGSMALRLHEIRKVQRTVRLLITTGVLITFVLAAMAAWAIAGLPGKHALVFASLVTVTGPTVIRPIVRRLRLRPEVAAVLEGEAILADPLGAILAAVCLEYAVAPGATAFQQAQELGIRLLVGGGIGCGVGLLAGMIVKHPVPALERIKPLLVLACALGCYDIAEQARRESGIMAVVAAGLTIQIGIAAHDRGLRDFKELMTTLLLSMLFILLAANMRRDRMLAEGLPGLLTVLTVILLVRPLNVILCTAGSGLNRREKAFISWVAPRGIVAASVASLGAIVLEREGQAGPHRVESLVFLIIFLTVLAQGATAGPVAWLLRITVREARVVLIVGANGIARLVAEAFRAEGKRVTVIDRNPKLVGAAFRGNLWAVQGDGTDREVLEEAGLRESDVLIALTSRTAVNQAAARVALHDHEVRQVWVALEAGERDRLDPVLSRAGAEVAFGRPIALDSWIADLEEGRARTIQIEVTGRSVLRRPVGDMAFPKDLVPLLVRRNGRVTLVGSSTRLQAGDQLTVLAPARVEERVREALEKLAAQGLSHEPRAAVRTA